MDRVFSFRAFLLPTMCFSPMRHRQPSYQVFSELLNTPQRQQKKSRELYRHQHPPESPSKRRVPGESSASEHIFQVNPNPFCLPSGPSSHVFSVNEDPFATPSQEVSLAASSNSTTSVPNENNDPVMQGQVSLQTEQAQHAKRNRSEAQRRRRRRERAEHTPVQNQWSAPPSQTSFPFALAAEDHYTSTISNSRSLDAATLLSNRRLLSPPPSFSGLNANADVDMIDSPSHNNNLHTTMPQRSGSGVNPQNGGSAVIRQADQLFEQYSHNNNPDTIVREHSSIRPDNFCIARRPYTEPMQRHDLGHMSVACNHCHAFHWEQERTTGGHFGTCCDGGQVVLTPLSEPPRVLRGLLEGQDAAAQRFRANITQYNAALAFTSLGADESTTLLTVTVQAIGCFGCMEIYGIYQVHSKRLPVSPHPMLNSISMTQLSLSNYGWKGIPMCLIPLCRPCRK
ncbi:hypothetical protein D9758_013956 [Tetrapyrgos nigripes]|uniref:Uncharacterized protein n=1 Tax=Tetrapyrgos nigripes TaxID=182062 RepID=A0A8H5CI59_9AGAR|nr:hypothetical protein D9758_013956 [Tetrapyrgos nigripes]